MSFCDPILVSSDASNAITPFNSREAMKFAKANFNTLSGWVCADNVAGRQNRFYSTIRYNAHLMDSLAAWNVRHGKSLRRFVTAATFDPPNYASDAAADRSSPMFVDSLVQAFGPKAPPARRRVLQGYHIGDEPEPFGLAAGPGTFKTMENYHPLSKLLHAKDPGAPDYANLYASSFGTSIGGISTKFPGGVGYREYMTSSIAHPGGILAFDHYPFYHEADGSIAQDTMFFQNLEVATEVARASGRSLIPTLQANEQVWCRNDSDCPRSYAPPDLPGLRFQAGSALAYGAKGIAWYSYRSQVYGSPGSPAERITSAIIYPDLDGSPLQAWLAAVNGELLAVGPTLLRSQPQGAAHGSARDPVSGERLPWVIPDSTVIPDEDKGYLLLGVLDGARRSTILVVCNKDRSKHRTFAFAVPGVEAVRQLSKQDGKLRPVFVRKAPGKARWTTRLAPGDYVILHLGEEIAASVFRSPR